jgi:hypothetical protein
VTDAKTATDAALRAREAALAARVGELEKALRDTANWLASVSQVGHDQRWKDALREQVGRARAALAPAEEVEK